MNVFDVSTPALVVDRTAFDFNVATMSKRRPGPELRPHVKAFKSTALAAELVAAGHEGFCCATLGEMAGMARAGLGHDLLLANEIVDTDRIERAMAVADETGARFTFAVDSETTAKAAADAGAEEVLIDVYVGLPRCGCPLDQVERLAEYVSGLGLSIRGVMGYEGHLVHVHDLAERTERVEQEMETLLDAHRLIGGDIISGGGTGTYDINNTITELQAGSYVLMDGEYGELELPFKKALRLITTVISTNPGGWAVLDGGLKALAMDQGIPSCDTADVLYCSDEHTVVIPPADDPMTVGERVMLDPVHLDPTVAKHDRMYVVDGAGEIQDVWPIDLKGWDVR